MRSIKLLSNEISSMASMEGELVSRTPVIIRSDKFNERAA